MTVVVVVTAVAACTSPSTTETVPNGTGGATPTAPTSRQLLARDVDDPAPPDCSNPRYVPPPASKLPPEYETQKLYDDYRYTSARLADKASSQHFLCGYEGSAVDEAWTVDQGRPDVTIAVLDSGIEWRDKATMAELAPHVIFNTGELPLPERADGSTYATYDANGDGVVNVFDYEHDPRVHDNGNKGFISPEDVIKAFTDGIDHDHDGYPNDIAGWNFLQNNNDPFDDVGYGHGSGEARDSDATPGSGSVGTCPNCTFIPVKVGDSFIADGGRFAAGVLFALDRHASVIQEALGALNNPSVAQAAVDQAYAENVPVVASMADEESEHANLPAMLNHTIPVNSVTQIADSLGDLGDVSSLIQNSDDFLSLNGCTNYGAIAWVTVASSSCSSNATGLAAGMVGLIESEARDQGLTAAPGSPPGGNVLSANEVAQLLRGTADDIDFSTPRGNEPANDQRTDIFARYPTSPGWDATFGYGRLNAYEAVRATAAGQIPPEADITSPTFFSVYDTTGSVPVSGRVAADRSSSYSWQLQWTTGLQPAPYPASDTWHTVSGGTDETAPHSGVLGTLDLAAIAAALPDDGNGPSSNGSAPAPDKFAVRVRLVVTDAEGRHALDQHEVFVHHDPETLAGFPKVIPGIGASSPAFADLLGDGRTELIVGTDDGQVHAYLPNGSELPGWPVSTPPAPFWHSDSAAAHAAGISPPDSAIGLGAPVVADLDGDGHMEVAATDIEGNLSVWDANGSLRFRVSTNPAYSEESATNSTNRLKRGFLAQPAAADLDGDGHMELIAAAMDRHVYAWHSNGTPVAGFPVLVADPATTTKVDPATNQVTFNPASGPGIGGELITTPAVGDLLGNGHPVIVVGAQEQYTKEAPAVSPPVSLAGTSANTREYAIWGDGTLHPAQPGAPASANPDANAYLPGWPAKLAMLKSEVLPTVGDGVATQAAIGDVTGTGHDDVVVTSADGPVYVLGANGRSIYGGSQGPVPLEWLGTAFGSKASSHDEGLIASAFGGPALGDLNGDGHPDVTTATAGLVKAIDQLLPGHQAGDTQLMAWDAVTNQALPGFPHTTSDLAFFVTPSIADADGTGHPDVIAANGVNLLDAVDAQGDEAAGFPKLTGGWSVGTPAIGDWLGDGSQELAISRRDGTLLVWRLPASTTSAAWPRYGHDSRNSGDASTPAG